MYILNVAPEIIISATPMQVVIYYIILHLDLLTCRTYTWQCGHVLIIIILNVWHEGGFVIVISLQKGVYQPQHVHARGGAEGMYELLNYDAWADQSHR